MEILRYPVKLNKATDGVTIKLPYEVTYYISRIVHGKR
jgi:hypothetical protein